MEKKNITILCGATIVAFGIGYFVGDATAINRVNKAVNTHISQQTSKNTTGTQNSSNESKKKNQSFKFGEEGKSGNWKIKVLDANEATTIQGGDSSDNKTTQQKFIVIKLQMTNVSQSPLQYSDKEFALGNIKDKKEYQVAFEAMQTANSKETIYNKNSNFFGVYDDVNPSMPKQTYVIFEVPKDFNISDGVLINANSKSEAVGFFLK